MAASNIRFCYDNLIDTASLTESSQVSTLPVENIQDPRLRCKWKTTGDSSENVVADLGSAQAVNCIAILNHNISSSVTNLRIQGHTSDSWADPDVNINLLDPVGDASYNAYNNKIIIWYSTSSSKRYWRVLIEDASNPDGYIEIGRIFLGAYFEPSAGVEQGININKKDLSEVVKNMQGTPYANLKDKVWGFNFNINNIQSDPAGTDDLQSFIDIFDDIGNSKNIVISLDPDRGSGEDNRYSNLKRFSVYGLMTKDFESTDIASKKFSSSFTFEESI